MTVARNLALTGVPRGGTTLCCQLLGRMQGVVALFEPMDVAALPPARDAALEEVAAFYAQQRDSLGADGTCWSQQVGGQVPDNPFSSQRGADGQRRREAERGRIRLDAPPEAGFTLAIKHNAAFTALLPELAERFETCAVVRNPLAVLASWHSLDLPVSRGRLPAGEHLDPALAAQLEAEPDCVTRQLIILDWIFGRFERHLPAARVLGYEAVVASGGRALAQAYGGLDAGVQPLQERNASRLYPLQVCEPLAERLLADQGAWRSRYGDDDIRLLLQRMRGDAPA